MSSLYVSLCTAMPPISDVAVYFYARMFLSTFAETNIKDMKENTKDWIHYTAASALIISAIVMAFVSFFMTMDIGAGPLTYIGESLSAALGLFGIGIYAVNKVNSISRRMDRRFNELEARERGKEVYNEEDN